MAVVAGQDDGLIEKQRGERGLSGRQGEACQGFNYGAPPVSIVQFTSSSSSCSGVLHVWVEVTFPSVENLKAGLPFILRKIENFLQNRCRLLGGVIKWGHRTERVAWRRFRLLKKRRAQVLIKMYHFSWPNKRMFAAFIFTLRMYECSKES